MRRACKYALVKMAALFVAQYSEQVLFANLLRALQRHTLNESERSLCFLALRIEEYGAFGYWVGFFHLVLV